MRFKNSASNGIKNTLLILMAILVLTFGGCSIIGKKVQVPPAHVGKILTKDGYKLETVKPSKFRLDPCIAYCDALVLLEVSDKPMRESFQLFMPKDQLNMSFDVRMTMSVVKEQIDSIYDRIPPNQDLIPFETVYVTYAQPVIRDVVRQIISRYSINEVASSRESISQELFQAVSKALDGTALSIKRFGLADVQFPTVITNAKENAAKRREEIEQERAQLEKQKIILERELEQAKMMRAIEREKAEGTREVNEILAKSVNDKYLAYRGLEVLEKMAQSDNKVFVPVEALGTVGLQQALFEQQVKKANKGR
ncbi:Band 7 protein [Catenovulum sp. SM1970]|uniref:SPFH domain-containing protein n=1 Tax=Marinifaba aquimaris TaxID=2741323 RepID=UPI00157470EE|nr:SPFH domain-containing protein [Marinifaba aquimaris]NTS77213.1 Band 7 protein [Marinifaba aquimaris]